MKLFLDDERSPKDVLNYLNNPIYNENWVIVRTFKDFKEFILNNGIPNVISFDHDLADFDGKDEFTGMSCVKWLVNYIMDNNTNLPDILIHSRNNVGGENIEKYFLNFKKHY